MKKNLLSMFALATMLLATGCSQEEEIQGVDSNELVEVTFNLASGEGAQSRAISDGKKAKLLYYGVFDQEGNVIPTQHGQTTMEDPTVGTTVTFRLVKGQTYDFVFWAQTPDNKYYNVNAQNLTEISVNYGTDANDESRDAFFANELDYTVEGHFTKSVTLYRPFGQLNVGTTIEDYNQATTLLSGNEVNKSKLVVKNIPNTLNLLTGEVSGSVTDATFNLAALPTDSEADYEILSVDTENNEETPDETYVHLSMNYLLAAETSALYEVDITFANGDEEKNVINTINVPNAPIQRNYRTNIIGQLLTTEGDFVIKVDPIYAGDHNYFLNEYSVASTAELLEVLKTLNAEDYTGPTNVTINLAADVEWATGASHGSTPLLEATSKVETLTINGQGTHKLTATGSGVGAIRAANGATITFNDMTIDDNSASYAENSWELGYLEFAGSLKFNDVNFVKAIMICGGTANNTTAASAEFINCTFNSNNANEYAVWVSGETVSFTDCTFNGNRGAKIHECYGSVVKTVSFNSNTFNIKNKPGIVIGLIVAPGEQGTYGGESWTKPADSSTTTISITNNVFNNCGAADTGCPSYADGIYESDTNVETFDFVMEGNSVVNKENTLVITSAAGLKNFAELVNSGAAYASKVELGADIDLENVVWTPIGNSADTPFGGTFDGKNYTISNLVVESDEMAGLFGKVGKGDGTLKAEIKNLKLDGVKISSSHWAGAVAANMTSSTIMDCEVNNAKIILSVENGDNGDKAGGIVGYMSDSNTNTVQNCKVTNSTIQAYHDLGGIVGYNTNGSVSNNTIENVTLVVDQSNNYKEYTTNDGYDADDIVGENGTNASESNNTGTATIKYIDATGLSKDAEGNYVVATATDMLAFADAVNNGVGSIKNASIKLTANIDLAGIDWKPIGQTGGYSSSTYFQGIFDGDGHTISNLTVTHWEAGNDGGKNYASGLFGFLDCGQSGSIKNLTIEGAVVKGHHWCGVIAGYTSGTVENCVVKNATVECTHVNGEACGDKAGVITGYINGIKGTVKNCQAVDSTVKAGRDGGQIVGAAQATQVVDCSVTNVTVSATGDCTDDDAGKNINNSVIGRVL